ncbi:phosphoribosylamine--glycine ligase [Candidatus Micrarchaeota archaeon]|nr:phosphoribosylamine--glycine ligase [Candidatus Micrarchaeota archaeon]
MRILLIGNGAREHIIAEKLAQDSEVYVIMSKKNPAIAAIAKEHWICNIENPQEVSEIVKNQIIGKIKIDIGFASPDGVLAAGVSDVLENAGIPIASPKKAAARIEWDKSFMRLLLEKHKIAGQIKHKIVNNEADARAAIIALDGSVAIKPLGLTGGKGVKVSGDHFTHIDEGMIYVHELLDKDGVLLIEEKVEGEEFSLQAFSDGHNVVAMPPVQDHKRAFSYDRGNNTGGMGSYSTGPLLPFLEKSDIDQATRILQAVVSAMHRDGVPFKGILYGQFMATKNGIRVIEFNARFADPESINVLALLDGSLSAIFKQIAEGSLKKCNFLVDSTVVKYLVPEGYPDNPKPNEEVKVNLELLKKLDAKIYYASVYEKNGKLLTTGSRAFAILGQGTTIDMAEAIAEKGCKCVSGPLRHRADIGTNDLIQKRVDHMKKLRER